MQTYVGFEWAGWWFVCATLPFGWKESPFIYHTIGLAVSSYLRRLRVPCSLYIDDRLNGELFTPTGTWAVIPSVRSNAFRKRAATTAIFIVLSVLVRLGYTIGIPKSTLYPVQLLEYLGIRLSPGYLFRSVSKTGKVACSSLQSTSAQARLDTYVGHLHGHLTGSRFTLHGFRSGAAVSMALADVALHDVMDHVWWRTTKTALSLFSSHRKNWFAARCEYLHLLKKNSQQANWHCEFFLIRCKYSQRAANQFLR